MNTEEHGGALASSAAKHVPGLDAHGLPASGTLERGDAIAAAGATAPRVALRDMKDRIVGTFYALGSDFMPWAQATSLQHIHDSLGVLTICILVLDNGWTLVGKSAPASAENFDAEKGQLFAYEDAIRQLWPLEGYRLRNQLWAVEQPKDGDDHEA